MKQGYYLIKHLGYLLPARFDGEMWHHEHGTSFARPSHENVVCDENKNPIVLDLSCPTGCSCTTNSDGSVTVKCTGGGPENP